ncbi:MAG: CBS domain-containing protein, partial [Actinomycetota bacterium]
TMRAQPAPTQMLIRISDSATIQDAARLMCDMSMGCLGVDDDAHEFIGFITERDVMWAAAQGKDPLTTHVASIANDFPIILDGPISIDEAASTMVTAHVRHLLVREAGDIRVLSMRDLFLEHLRPADRSFDAHLASVAEMYRMFGEAIRAREVTTPAEVKID